MKKTFLFLPFTFLLFTCLSFAQTLAPNAPGKDAQWASAGKQGVGTSATLESKVWFTLQGGALTEVYYPDVTVANVHLLQFVVVNSKTRKVETERDDTIQTLITENQYYGGTPLTPLQIAGLRQSGVNIPNQRKQKPEDILIPENSLQFIQRNTAKSGKWKISKRYITDVDSNTILIRVFFETADKNLELYLYYDSSLGNSGMHDTAWNQDEILLVQDKDTSSALIIGEGRNSEKITDVSNGFYQVSDGLEQLRRDGRLSTSYQKAENGNVVQMAKIASTDKKSAIFTLSLGFGNTPQAALVSARNSLKKGFDNSYNQFVRGWNDYVKTLHKVEPKYQAQFNMAAMQLKAHEDKANRGANIASLSVPWGGGDNANENNVGGYHLVWSRDLYQVATAFMALGDKAAAERALDFLFKIQQKADGSFPQNSWLDGKPFWGSLQLDEVAFPLILAYQLGKNDKATYENHVKKAADFLVKTGPKTPQERWEEKSGYSPSTIAAEIAGLVCAADIARKNGDEASATIYLATADDWARNVERWTATTNGKYGDGNYYIRLTENGKPDALEKTVLNNNGGTFIENEIVDAGFLELVRLGIKSPDDKLIEKSVKVVDQVIKVNTPNGEGFYRYNHDGYGEMDDGRRWNWDGKYTGKGRLWALLSGERGQYELAYANSPKFNFSVDGTHPRDAYIEAAKKRLETIQKFANDGLMIPEQIWDKAETPKNIDRQFIPELKFGEGTGSATPLAWSMAQFIRLAVNLQNGKNLDTPDVVYNRYVKNGIPGQASNFGGTDEEIVLPVKAGEKFGFSRPAPKGAKIGYIFGGKTNFIEVGDEGKFSVEVIAPEKEEIVVVGIEFPNGATAFERVKVRSADKAELQKFSSETIEKIKNAKQSPLIENGKAILFYRGEAKSVMVAGDMTNWNPGRIFMQKIAENLFAAQLDFAPTARVEYKFIVDGKWINDELNTNKLDNGVGGANSFFKMPDYKATTWDDSKEMTKPVIEIIQNESKIYGEKREIKVYVPEGFSNQSLPVLYVQDGSDYIKRADAITIQRNLVKANKIKPFIMVFIDYKDRTKEYFANDDYAKFLAEEVVPAIDAKYNTIKTREGRAILGASLGGITSFWVGVNYPDKFARIGGQSSSFWVDDGRVVKELEKLDASKNKFTFYIDDGTLEGVEDSRRVNVMLRGKGFPVTYIEGETGHNWTSWRDRLADAFIALWK